MTSEEYVSRNAVQRHDEGGELAHEEAAQIVGRRHSMDLASRRGLSTTLLGNVHSCKPRLLPRYL